MRGWNFADVWEAVAEVAPDRVAVVHGDRRVSWSDLDRHADAVAAWLLGQGLGWQDRVAQYLYNGPEYLESLFGIMKAGLVPVNTNYRYLDDELVHLWSDAGAAAVVFHGSFGPAVERVRSRVPGVGAWLYVDDGSGCPDWATSWADVLAGSEVDHVVPTWGRSGDDLYLLYTGGTTGMPKGVMWRQDDWFVALNAPGIRPFGDEPDLDLVRREVARPGPVTMPACPLMHGTGGGAAMGALSIGGTVALLARRSFDPVELLDVVESASVKSIYLIGDAQMRPVLDALEAGGRSRDLTSLRIVISSGAMLGAESKRRLHAYLPRVAVIDTLGSSEALGAASSVSQGSDGAAATARFRPGPHTKVIDDDGREVEPGSGEVGRVAVGGRIPLGYHGDPSKTAATFISVDGARYSVAGDHATVAADGMIEFLGRGSVSINTGGEKVFPDEVEAVLKELTAVHDAVVVGVPDERFGSVVTAVVELGGEITDAEVIAHARTRLAAFKAPRHIVRVTSIGRAANGKADYQRLRDVAVDQVVHLAPAD